MNTVIKRFISDLKIYHKRVYIIIFCGTMMSAASGQLAIQVKHLFDSLEGNSTQTLLQTAYIVLGLTFLMAFGRYFHNFYTLLTSDQFSTGLRERLLKKYLDLDLSFHLTYKNGIGGLLSRAINDVNIVQQGLRNTADLFKEPLLLIFLLGWLFYLNWQLTLALLVFLPIAAYIVKQIGRSLRKYSQQSQVQFEGLTQTLRESLEGMRVIQAYNLENFMAKRLSKQGDDYLRSRKKANSRLELAGPITEWLATAIICSIFVYMGYQISQGTTSLGDFMSFLTALLMLQAPIKKIQEGVVRLQETLVALGRVYELLDSKNKISEATSFKPFPKNFKKIEFKNISFSYDTKPILKNINISVNQGDVIALVGESGSGKSTLLNLLARFFDATQGQVLIDDTPTIDIKLSELRSNMALVSQDIFLFNDSIKNNLLAGHPEANLDDAVKAAQSANAHSFIQRLENQYDQSIGERGHSLSGGERQRLSIARAMIKNAPILLLDEATSALDSLAESEVQRGLETLMQGRTTFVVAHRLSLVTKANKIFVFKDGQIVEAGSHMELISNQQDYYRFWQQQTST